MSNDVEVIDLTEKPKQNEDISSENPMKEITEIFTNILLELEGLRDDLAPLHDLASMRDLLETKDHSIDKKDECIKEIIRLRKEYDEEIIRLNAKIDKYKLQNKQKDIMLKDLLIQKLL